MPYRAPQLLELEPPQQFLSFRSIFFSLTVCAKYDHQSRISANFGLLNRLHRRDVLTPNWDPESRANSSCTLSVFGEIMSIKSWVAISEEPCLTEEEEDPLKAEHPFRIKTQKIANPALSRT